MNKKELMEMDNVVVKLRNGFTLFKIGNFLIDDEGFDKLDNYDDELFNSWSFDDLDIVSVYRYNVPAGGFKGVKEHIINVSSSDFVELLWERR